MIVNSVSTPGYNTSNVAFEKKNKKSESRNNCPNGDCNPKGEKMVTIPLKTLQTLTLALALTTGCFDGGGGGGSTPVGPVNPPIVDPVEQSPVQKALYEMVNEVHPLNGSNRVNGVSRSYQAVAGDILSLDFTDTQGAAPRMELDFNADESTSTQSVYDGVCIGQFSNEYLRWIATKNPDGSLLVKKYGTRDGNPPSPNTTWDLYDTCKYAKGNNAIKVIDPSDEKQYLNIIPDPNDPNGLIKQNLYTGKEYKITGFSVVTK